ncbi:MAG: HAMP domain-containing sensor histidine kinase [Bdellovibrionota bacterium]
MNKNESRSFKNERGQTDTSLNTERGRTDESLSELRDKTALDTDLVVQKNRELADEVRAQSRSDADLDLARAHKASPASGNDVVAQEVAADVLAEQRSVDDSSVKAERKLMDAAMVRERKINSDVAAKLLGKERGETDHNLSLERAQTDSEVDRASGLLNDEQSLHTATKAALTTRDEFLAIVSHDLRNPIGAILSGAQFLLDPSLGDELSDNSKKLIELIKRNAETSLRLIQDIMDMERVAEGKMRFEFAKTDMSKIINDTVQTFVQLAIVKNITVNASFPVRPIYLNCDSIRIVQVLSNLIGNAIKFTPANGTINIVSTFDSENVYVSVSDSGPGVPAELRNKIFERFAQINDKDRRGLGLGLYIAKMFVEGHKGKISVTSNESSGSKFEFSLPIHANSK